MRGVAGRFRLPFYGTVVAALLAGSGLTSLTGEVGAYAETAQVHTVAVADTDAVALPQLVPQSAGDPATGAASAQPACTDALMAADTVTVATPGRTTLVSHDGASVSVGGTAVSSTTSITATSLCADQLPPLDQGMTNVTKGPRRGYRFLPHMTFGAAMAIKLPYDPSLIPAGLGDQDVATYYYDVDQHRWQRLDGTAVNAAAGTVTSSTNHFTDFVNATITVPDHPGTLSYDPTSIKDIKAADPGTAVDLIDPPQAGSDGAAHLGYPIALPGGRHGQMPSVALSYDSSAPDGGSAAADGWLGLGWDLALPSVTIDTRWGVPRYDAAGESETYSLNGAELSPVANRGPLVPRTAEKVFHSRVESTFAKIVRHGGDPASYWWEATGKDGVRAFYGGDPDHGRDPDAVLADGAGHVFRWALKETRDLVGNTVHYTYKHVSDAGVPGGTVTGTNLYPATINYTGTGDAAGAYTVTFVRDRDIPGSPRRPDVSINGRGGFVMVTADLLKQIKIDFNGQPVRSYQLDYTTGAFNKTLLKSVSQYGANGTLFNTHTFAYYDDARNTSGDYHGFATPADVNTGGDGVTAGLLDQGHASALSGSMTTSIGGHLYLGFNPVSPTKQFSAGAKVGFTHTSGDGVLAMIDLNGDTLPDKVFEQDGKAYFRLNTTTLGGAVTFADQSTVLPTLPAISHDSSNQFSFGAEAYFGANVFANQSETFSTSDTYFQDVNGDGLPDLVSGGQVLFNHLGSDGLPTFTDNSADTPVPIGGGAIDTSGLGVDFTAQQQQAAAADPPVDTLRRWVAPFDGTVSITGDVELVKDTSAARAQYRTADGVRVAIQQNGAELWSTAIGATDYAPQSPAGVGSLTVHQGDRFYFRVQSVDDGKYDHVSWDPVIAYQDVTPYTDVNKLDVFSYHASADFTTAGRRGAIVQAPLTGTVHLAGAFHKLGATTDDITVQVLLNGDPVYNQPMSAAQTGDLAVDQDIAVHLGDTLALRVKVDSPIDVNQLSWAPRLYYTSSPSAKVLDPDGNPIVQLHPPVDTDLYPVDDLGGTVQQAWTAPSDDTVTVHPQLAVAPGTDGTLTFTVKRRGELVFKEPISITGGSVPDEPFSLPVSAGEQLFFDYSSPDPALTAAVTAQGVQVTDSGGSTTAAPSALHGPSAPGLVSEPYRGWAYVSYNGAGARASAPVVESDLNQTFDQNTRIDLRTQKAYPLLPSPADGAWLGSNSDIYLKSDTASSSRLSSPTLGVPTAGAFAGARAPDKVSHASQTAVGGGISFLSGSADSGSTTSDVDYLDMNGSGFPAVVSGGHVQYPDQTGALAANSVAVPGLGDPRSTDASSANVGVGGSPAHFSANAQAKVDNAGHAPSDNTTGSQMVQLGLSGSLGRGDSHPQTDLVDVNGDGLPDKVSRDGGGISVALNLGYSFAPAEPWGAAALGDGSSENGSIGASLGFNNGIYDFAGGVSLSKNKSQTDEELIDLNGDGLPDRVINTSGGMRVAFNLGTGFAAPVAWPGAPNGACHDSTSVGLAGIDWDTARLCNGETSLGAGVYFTVGIGPLCLAACYIIINPGADGSQSMAREEAVLRDVDGNGTPDYMASTGDGRMTVADNDVGRTNLLKSVGRPLGASFTLDYKRTGNTVQQPQQRWVMSKVTVNPGPPGDAVTQAVSYDYAGGVYNRLERQFYDFATVTERQLDTTHGNSVYRTIVHSYRTDSYYTHGLPTDTKVYDADGNLFTETQQTYDTRDVLTGAEPANIASTTATIFPMLVRTDERFYEGGTSAQKATYTTQHYDSLGNVDQTLDVGDPGTGADVVANSSYVSCPDTYLMAMPASILVTDADGKVLRHRAQSVDCATGNVTQIRQFLADGSAATTDMTYLPNGDLASVTNPPNAAGQRYRVDYEYDPTVATYITKTTDSFGLSSTSTPDLRFGGTLSETDVNNQSTTYQVDEFGRTVSVTGPYQQGSGIATITFEYHPDAAVPWALTRHADVFRGPGDTIDTVTFIDGLKRVLQTKKSATVFTGANASPQDVMQVSGHVTFDFLGRTVAMTYPTTEPLGSAGVYNTAVDPVAPTTFAFDVLDRNVRTALPDGTAVTTDYGFGADRSGTVQFAATATDANGHKKVTFRNVRELLVSQEQFSNGTPVWTSYGYDPINELRKVTDDHGAVTTTAYDLLGRRTDVTNPDAGHVTTVYDLASNQVARITPNLRAEGKQVGYGYDFNRLTSIHYPDNPGNDVAYTYGAPGAAGNGAGRAIKITDASGTLLRSYGRLGEVTKEVKTVNILTGAPKPTYTTQYTYDTFGRIQNMVYPDGEALTYHYDSGGAVNRITGVKGPNGYTYVNRFEYDKFGAKAFVDFGNNVTTTYAYNPLNRRLANLRSASAGGADFQNLSYGYDHVGNLTSLANDIAVQPNGPSSGQGGGPTSQTFGYDDLDRLTGASGVYTFAPGKQNTYTVGLGYDSADNVVSKTQLNQIVESSGHANTQKDTSYDFSYAYDGPQEHAPTHIGRLTYSYDADGNQTGFTDDDSGRRQTIAWNEENQIQSLSDNGQKTDYVYDDSGQRVIKRGKGGETVYVNQFFTIRNNQIGTKQIIVGGSLIAEKMAMHDPAVVEKQQYYFHPDQIGSGNYVTDTGGKIFEHLEYFPSGETWVQEASDTHNIPYQFGGKQYDAESGFYYFGARYYNPRTGIFVSTDPALSRKLQDLPEDPAKPSGLDTFAPSFLNLYNYADDEPLTKVDPDGQQAVPLTTFRLRAIARAAGVGAGLPPGVLFNRAVGRAFQEFANNALGLTENFTPYPSPVRAAYGGPPTVIPDAVRNITRVDITMTWHGMEMTSTTYPNSSFFEVKAVNGTLNLSSSNQQIRGLVDIAARSPAGAATGPDRVLPTITFITTANTIIGPDVLAEATRRGVAVWQVVAYEVPGSAGGTQIGFGPALPLNPQVFPSRGLLRTIIDGPYVPVPPIVGGASPGTLGPANGGGPPLQPDPVIVE